MNSSRDHPNQTVFQSTLSLEFPGPSFPTAWIDIERTFHWVLHQSHIPALPYTFPEKENSIIDYFYVFYIALIWSLFSCYSGFNLRFTFVCGCEKTKKELASSKGKAEFEISERKWPIGYLKRTVFRFACETEWTNRGGKVVTSRCHGCSKISGSQHPTGGIANMVGKNEKLACISGGSRGGARGAGPPYF